MSTSEPFIGVDTSRSNHDTVDDETVILDSTTGVLTLLVDIGPLIWERLVGGLDRSSLVAEVTDVYGAEAGADVDAFLEELTGYMKALRRATGASPRSPASDVTSPTPRQINTPRQTK